MGRVMRIALAFTLVVAIVSGGLLSTGCGESKAALVKPTITLFQFQKGSTVDFDDATIDSAAGSSGENGFKFGIMKSIYYTLWNSKKETMANYLFPAPYWKGDGVNTKYAFLTSGDAMTVDGYIFATLSDNAMILQEMQDNVVNSINGFFTGVDNQRADAKAPSSTSAYAILKAGAGEAAANAWAADVAAGKDYADRFFIHLVKQFVTAYPSNFAPYWLAIFGYTTPPASPSDAEIEAVARVAGETSFKNGIASSMYPADREAKARSMYSKAYKDLTAAEKPYVDSQVYAGLLTAFGADAAVSAATRDAIRNSMAANLKTYYGLSSDNYSLLTGVEKAKVDQAVGAQLDKKDATYGYYTYPLGFGPHLERDYIDFYAVPGAILGWGAELGASLPWEQTSAYLALSTAPVTGTVSSAKSFVKDVVDNGVPMKSAFYRWLAKEPLIALKGMGTLIRLSDAEFLFEVNNPNKYAISIDSAELYFYVNSTALSAAGNKVDTAKVAISDKIWVPAESKLLVKVIAPVKVLDMITWVVMSGQTSANATKLASDVWAQYQAGTQSWMITIDSKISDDEGRNTIAETYTL